MVVFWVRIFELMNLIVDDNHVAYFFGFKIEGVMIRHDQAPLAAFLGGGKEEVGVFLLNK
jgi:hypothetical protein